MFQIEGLYGGNPINNGKRNGDDSFGPLVDLYAWNPHCQHLDELGSRTEDSFYEQFDGAKAIRGMENWLIENYGFQPQYAASELTEKNLWRKFDAGLFMTENLTTLHSRSDAFDNLARSSESGSSGNENIASYTKSDLDFYSEGVVAEPKVERYFTADEGLHSMTGLENGSLWVHHLIRRKMEICF